MRELWDILAAGRRLIREAPAERIDAVALRAAPGQDKVSLWGAFLDDADRFDAGFFSVSPREAAWMDPQQRWALELAFNAMEDAAIKPSSLAGAPIGVFMGACHWDYAELIEKHTAQLDAYTPTGIALSIIANRVSHFFDFRGPSVVNDTACAASHVAVHDAVRALQAGDCALALAGGVNLIWSPNHFVTFSKNGMLSKTGGARVFDAGADGYVRGEGGAMLLLKPLAAALADGDPIHAVIRGAGLNHGGRANSLTATNPQAQAELIANVWDKAGVAPGDVDYVEAHGTGTPLGDPIEIAGLKQAMQILAERGRGTAPPGSCGVGSVKSNLGHMEGAAGVVGIAKIIAALRYGGLPPNAGFERINELIALDGSPFRIQSALEPWPRAAKPRRAGVSAFGFGGANAHIVLEEAPPPPPSSPETHGESVIRLSGRTPAHLRANVAALRAHVMHEGPNLADLARSLRDGREAFVHRATFRVAAVAALIDALDRFLTTGEAHESDDDAPTPDGARRIHAVGSAFLRERHWFDTTLGAKDASPAPHPMLRKNVSQLGKSVFRSVFDGSESFWAGHEALGRQIMPGAATLEMARAAGVAALGEARALRLESVVWLRPIAAAAGGARVDIALAHQSDGAISFRISDGDVLFAQGVIASDSPSEGAPLDFGALRCAPRAQLSVDACYERLRASGVVHGAPFRAIASLHRGPQDILAELRLSRLLLPTLAALELHPILVDAAIQVWAALDDVAPVAAHVPFSCDAITVHAPCSAHMWALVRRRDAGQAAGIVRLDIDIADEAGRLCVSMRGLVLRAVEQRSNITAERSAPRPRSETLSMNTSSDQTSAPANSELLFARGMWDVCRQNGAAAPVETQLLLFGWTQSLAQDAARRSGLAIEAAPAVSGGPGAKAMAWTARLQSQIAALMAQRPQRPQQIIALVPETDACGASALAAMLRTAHAENPNIFGAAIIVAGLCDAERLVRLARDEAARRDRFSLLRYDAQNLRQAWRPSRYDLQPGLAPTLDSDGVYWITGGGGGLGSIFIDALAARGARRIIASGRAATATLPPIEGVRVDYHPCDVTDSAAVASLVAQMGDLRGVIHAAGALDDALLHGAALERTAPALAPKMLGAVNIDQATRDHALDFFVLFSSVAASFANPGQSVYAAGNGFLDGFAERRAALVAQGERRGVTLSMGWPLWAEGGMGQSPQVREALRRRFGAAPLPTRLGVDVFWRALAAGAPHIIALHGEAERLSGLLSDPPEAAEAGPMPVARPAAGAAQLTAHVIGYLKDLLGEAVAMEPDRIRADAPLIDYGLNSIAIVDVTTRLEQALGPLSKTLFFEFLDIASLAAHLVETHGDALSRQFAPTAAPEVAEAPRPNEATPSAPIVHAVNRPDKSHDVAIVGLSLRVAGADDKDAFWGMLNEGRHAFGPVPQSRWNHAALTHDERDVLGKTIVRSGAFLDDIAGFDPRYFKISQYEAELMSPETRLFLQASVHAFEDAGYSRETLQRLNGDVAVIMGSMTNEYDYYGFENMLQRGSLASGSYTGAMPNMVSYFYGFTGPSYFLDTMCAASATCIHEAVHMLRAGRCRMALAGGVSLITHPQKLIATSQEHFTSKTATVIRGYGLGADGTILGEGVGAVVLKRLEDAERDNDHIYAVIKGVGVSNAGARNGFTVPSPAQQDAAIEQALVDAAINPETISYIEGHGSGTALGDPIEIRALTSAWRRRTDARRVCPIGTVKSNIGHLLAASGVAGIAKVLMQMRHERLVPSLHAETLNPNIPFAETPFYVQRDNEIWRRRVVDGSEAPRRAAVTSIGAGGVNNHIILEEYVSAPRLALQEPQAIVLSATTPERLAIWAERLAAFLRETNAPLSDIAYTLQVGRNNLNSRLAVVAVSPSDAAQALADFAQGARSRDGMFFCADVQPSSSPPVMQGALEGAAARWAFGDNIDWEPLHVERRRRIPLPSYPFEATRCWYPAHADAPSVVRPLGAGQKLHPLIDANISDLSAVRFSTTLRLEDLLDYAVGIDGERQLPPILTIEMIAAAAQLADRAAATCALRNLVVHDGDWNAGRQLEITLGDSDDGAFNVSVVDSEGAIVAQAAAGDGKEAQVTGRVVTEPVGARLDHAAIYAALAQRGARFHSYLQVLDSAVVCSDGTVFVTLRDDPSQQDRFKRNAQFSAPALAGALQALQLAQDAPLEPFAGVDAVVWSDSAVRHIRARGADLEFLDVKRRVIASWQGLRFGRGTVVEAELRTPEDGAIETRLVDIAAGLLKFAPDTISRFAHFHDLGFDSVSLTRFAAEISDAFGVAVSPGLFFQLEHIGALATHIAGITPRTLNAELTRRQRTAAPRAPLSSPRRPGERKTEAVDDGVAIIGLALRVPGADSAEVFIDRLLAGDDLVQPLPLERFTPDDAARLRRGVPCRGGSLVDIDRFDAALFRISPAEAERMDPRQRLILECSWRVLEDAGLTPEATPRATGVFIGASGQDWARLLAATGVVHDAYAATGVSPAMIANRVSHVYDWRGPSETIDTACSSSLVALCRAAQALRDGACEMALVGGVNLNLIAEGFEGPQSAGMLSPGGRCRSFGANADGYVRSEGVVCVLLKPLGLAQRDGDRISGVLRGVAVNHGGRAGAVTAPNARAQGELITRALGELDASSVTYVEAHGTGTALGDPAEVAGLQIAFGAAREGAIGLGSVKSAVGHMEAAAGLAGVAKVLLAMKRGALPPTLHCDAVNPHIRFDGTPLRLVRAREDWPSPRRAGVSSFGFGGVNAHVVIDEPPPNASLGRASLPPRAFATTRFWAPRSRVEQPLFFAPHFSETPLSSVAAKIALRRILIDGGFGVAGALYAPQLANLGEFYTAAAKLTLQAAQDAARAGAGTLIQIAVPLGDDRAILEGLSGLLSAAALEAPQLLWQVIGIAPDMAACAADVLAAEAVAPNESRLRYVAGRRLALRWRETPAPAPIAWRDGGVYLLVGGAGGIGRLIARDIARASQGSVLVLVGSGALDPPRQAVIDELTTLGARASYRRLDIADAAAVAALVAEILAMHGALNGVLHAAGVLRDCALLRKTPDDIDAVIAPKALGALALEAACRGLDLDIFAMFSSLASVCGNVGQADYAAANGFLDAFATMRAGKLTSISWPLWRDGGMSMDQFGEAALFARMGQRPLAADAGLSALRAAASGGLPHLAVVDGEAPAIRRFFSESGASKPGANASLRAPPSGSAAANSDLAEKIAIALRNVFAAASGLDASVISLSAPLDTYGVDSLMISRVNAALGARFAALDHGLLFQHRTLIALAGHLVESRPQDCARWLGADAPNPPAYATPVARSAPPFIQSDGNAIAIVGISGRYPGADDLDAFWDNLVAGKDMVREIPRDRWPLDGFFHPDPSEAARRGMSYSKWGGFIDGFADFDPEFFRIAPRDVAAMDPQERLFLMSAFAACEDAGYPPARLATRHGGRVGVFAGVTKTGFALRAAQTDAEGAPIRPTTSFASVANRVSYAFDFTGPSLPVDTMCSSSLTAIHAACEALRAQSCDAAIAGGVNLYLHPSNYVELCASRMLSPGGRCRSFGADADGFVPGEGVGVLLLKPLARAKADGDRIHAVILASAVNHGGRSNSYTAPNPAAQSEVIATAMRQAGVAPRDITYIEAHGTGTDLGDPVEASGLEQAFAGAPVGGCALGSAKSAIGHLEAAAGIAGVTKVILQMRHHMLAPTLHADPPNPRLHLESTPFVLVAEAQPWRAPRLIAGVSSFGAGGANAHVILAEPDPDFARGDDVTTQLIPLSARNPERLRVMTEQLLRYLEAGTRASVSDPLDEICGKIAELLGVDAIQIDPGERLDALGFDAAHALKLRDFLDSRSEKPAALDVFTTPRAIAASVSMQAEALAPRLSDIAWTLQIGREPMRARLAIVAASLDELKQGLRDYLGGVRKERLYVGAVEQAGVLASAFSGEAEALEDLTRRWVARGDLARLASLWTQGVDLDWSLLSRAAPPRIISLPTYPFRRERFWFDASDDAYGAVRRVVEDGPISPATPSGVEEALAPVLRAIARGTPADAVIPRYVRWRKTLDALLADAPVLALDEAWRRWDESRIGATAQGALAETALRALPEILSGAASATSVLFPSGSLRLVEAVYVQDPIAARFNAQLARAAAAFIAARRNIRILEIGAGSGSATSALLSALGDKRDMIAEYRFTDVSRAFLIAAERRHADWPALRLAIFDVERPLEGQDVEPGVYDLVIASNILHATRDIAQALANAHSAIAPGGLLLLNETSRATLFTHATFGLLDGWERAVDTHRRIAGTPSLTASAWREALEETRFEWLGVSPEAEQALGQQIVAARVSGEARVATCVARAPARVPQSQAPARPQEGEALELALRRLVADTLNVAPAAVDVTASFADYGLDSILGAMLVDRIRREFDVAVEHRQLFESRNVNELAAFLRPLARATLPVVAPEPVSPVAAAQPRVKRPIAIIGYSGRFAQSHDAEELWTHLAAGRDLVAPCARPGLEGRIGSFLDAIDRFDAAFFGISGKEARYMDPQQRLFLEEAWRTIEHAGRAGDLAGRRCGVFVGASAGDYDKLFRAQPPGQAFWGNTTSLIPGRIAYFLDLKGPAAAIDTACSSSLVALHLACQSLEQGECEMALAGGVFVQCTDRFFRSAEPAGMLSPTGRCAAFGEGADGIVPGEAVAALLLRPLDDALADGDTIYGVVRGSSVNQDGATNGITAPCAQSQEQLMRAAYAACGVEPASVSLIEAHGTGTPLGDPIEAAALQRIFGERDAPALLGSIKANIGHATTAAGAAGLIKILLALRHRAAPPALHVRGGNPAVRLEGKLRLNQALEPWEGPAPRRAAISSFGFGGANAHAVIEEAPPQIRAEAHVGLCFVVLSARTQALLRAQAEALLAHIAKTPGLVLADIAFTLAAGRKALAQRLALRAENMEELENGLRAYVSGTPTLAVREAETFLAGGALDIAALFPGGGRRIALPPTILAPTRHWVDDDVGVARPPAPVAESCIAPAKIRLDDAALVAVDVRRGDDPARSPGKIVLSPLSLAPGGVRRGVDASGLRELILSGACADALTREAAALDDSVHACLLRVERDAAPANAQRLLRDASIPIIGVAPAGDIASVCDFVGSSAQAEKMARDIAQAPRVALRALIRRKRSEPAVMLNSAAEARLVQLAAGAAGAAFASRVSALRSKVVRLEIFDDGVALLRMQDAAHRNMFTTELMDGLEEGFAAIAASSQIKVVVLTGDADCFALGGTRDGLLSLQQGKTRFTDRRIYALPLDCPAPVIAAMDGHAIGAGWSMGMFCDIQFFGEDSVFHSNYLQLGFTPGAGATLIFPARLGELGWELLFTAADVRGRALAARTPSVIALPNAGLLDAALKRAHRLAQTSRDILFELKAEVARPLRERIEATLAAELSMHSLTLTGNAEALRRIEGLADRLSAHDDSAAPKSVDANETDLRADIVAILAEELMIGPHDIGDETPFVDLGMDSILAVTFARRLSERFHASLPATTVYTHPNLRALLRHLASGAIEVGRAASSAPQQTVVDTGMLSTELAALLAEELMIAPRDIDQQTSFVDLGMDSILAVTFTRRLSERFCVSLPATTVYAHPDLRTLAAHLAQHAPSNAVAASSSGDIVDAPLDERPRPAQQSAAAPIPAVSAVAPREQMEPIAIVGASGRFPEAPDLDAFWTNIRTARDCIVEAPKDRWDVSRYYDPDPTAPGKSVSKWMGAIDGIDLFDPEFFNITPREAELMDPQQRLFLQHAWRAIEDAAIDPLTLAGTSCGVYVGAGPSGYADLVEERNAYSLIGAASSILAARIAYFLDFTGPTISLDTACSSSLVAIAQACNALQLRDCDLALAGGASVIIGPSMFIDTSKVGMLSPQGRCFAFDHRANGFVPGEGVGVVLLKRLSDALRDNDPVRAVIRGWGVNQDGRTNGITAPNPEAQTRLMRGLHGRFGIDPADIDLVECHGTGTALGDPIEIEGLNAAFKNVSGKIAIGSVKSNVGHLLAAAGVAGALKAVLALEAKELPPTALFEKINPHASLGDGPFEIATTLKPWVKRSAGPRRAAVSSFGFSGVNAHIIVEEAPPRTAESHSGPYLLPLAARTPERLKAYAGALKAYIDARPNVDLAALAVTYRRRTPFACRVLLCFGDRAALLAELARVAESASAEQEAFEWPRGDANAPRLNAPGYPFAEKRCWARPTTPQASPASIAPSDLEFGVSLTLTECGADVALASRDNRPLDNLALALALPFLACAAAAKAEERPILELTELVWGSPAEAAAAHEAAIDFHDDEETESLFYSIALDGGSSRHIGVARFAGGTVFRAPTSVRARRLHASRRSDGLDAALWTAMAELLVEHAGADRFPYAATRLWRAVDLQAIATLSLCEGDDGALSLVASRDGGEPVLCLENLRLRRRQDLADLSFDADQEAAE